MRACVRAVESKDFWGIRKMRAYGAIHGKANDVITNVGRDDIRSLKEVLLFIFWCMYVLFML